MGYPEAQYTIDSIQQDIKDTAPSGLPICDLTCSVISGNFNIEIYLEVKDLVVSSQLLSRFQSMDILCKKDAPPEAIDDGALVRTLTRDEMSTYKTNPLVYSDVEADNDYYIRLFPKSDHGVISYNRDFIYKIHVVGVQVFGFHQDFTQADPDAQITYIGLNKDFEPMMTNVDNGEYTMGSWTSWGWLNKVKPYMLDNNGNVDYALDPNDYRKKADGTESDILNQNYNGLGAYAWIPKLYIKETYDADGSGRTVLFTDNDIYASANSFHDFVFKNLPESFDNTTVPSIDIKGLWLGMFFPINNKSIYSPSAAITANSGGNMPSGAIVSYAVSNWKPNNASSYVKDHMGCFTGPIALLFRDLLWLLYRTTNISDRCGATIFKAPGWNSNFNSVVNVTYTSANLLCDLNGGGFLGHNITNIYGTRLFHSTVLGSPTIGLYGSPGQIYISSSARAPYPVTMFLPTTMYYSKSSASNTRYNMVNVPIDPKWPRYTNLYANKLEYIDNLGSVPKFESDISSSSTYLCSLLQGATDTTSNNYMLCFWYPTSSNGSSDISNNMVYRDSVKTSNYTHWQSCGILPPEDPNFTPYDEE